MIDTEKGEGKEDVNMTNAPISDIWKLSDRGISVLQGLAILTGDQELRDEREPRTSDARGGVLNTSSQIWWKVQNVFAHMFG